MSQYIKENIDTPVLDQELLLADDFGFYDVYTGYYAGPLFQHGQRPYVSVDGGGFLFNEDGSPIIAEWELMRIAVTVPMISMRWMHQRADGPLLSISTVRAELSFCWL